MTRKVLLPPELVDRLQRERAAIKTLVQAVTESDVQRFRKTLSAHYCDRYGVLRPAFKRIARLSQPSRHFQTAMVDLVADFGHVLRCELGDDLLLCEALRVLLPPYQGPAPLRLYRGDTAHNRHRRTYGASWSRDREVADSFAQNGLQRTCNGGSVLLETDASRAAIITAITHKHTSRNEHEVIIDRRYLGSVRVLVRYPQRALTKLNQ